MNNESTSNCPVITGAEQVKRKKKGVFSKNDPRINVRGRPRGSRSPSYAIIKEASEAVVGEAMENIKMAVKAGDVKVSQWLIELFEPAKINQYVNLDVPPIYNAKDLLEANNIINTSIFMGEITPDEGSTLGKRLEDTRKIDEHVRLEDVVTRVENALNKGKM